MAERTWTEAQKCAMKLRGRDILVSAAAGSGKTATLTERIIRSLLEVDENGKHTADISRMLVVTFTRAAAAELRGRISEELSKAIAAHPDDKYLYRQLVALGSAHICTIDSFYLEPVRANFERLGLPSTFRLADDSELMPIKEQLLNQLIEQHYEAAAANPPESDAPLDALTGNAFALAMDDLLPNRDRGNTAAVLLGLFEKLIAFPEGLELLRMGADRLCAQADLPFGETDEAKILSASLCEELEYHCSIIRPLCQRLATNPQTAKNYLPSFGNDLDTAEQILADLKAGLWESASARAAAYTAISLKGVPADTFHDLKEIQNARKDIVAMLRSLPNRYFADSPEEMRNQMLRTARTQRMLYTLLSDYDKSIRELKVRRAVMDFSDIRRYLLQLLLDENGKPTDVARALSDRFDTVYIDEYQDVDTVQDLIFSTIGAGGKRFMVGDIKQSIYTFRGAEPTIFSSYREKFTPVEKVEDAPEDTSKGCCVFMSENFRCDKSIIKFANIVCGHTFRVCKESLNYQPQDELKYGKDKDRPTYKTQVVVIETPPKAKRIPDPDPATALNPEAVYMADEIARLIDKETHIDGTEIHARDVAILLRGWSAAGDISEALRAHGIRVSYAAADDLNNDPDLKLLVNLLSVIDNPRDDVPLTGLLTAEGSPFALSDLLLLRNCKHEKSLYDDICEAVSEENESSLLSAETVRLLRAFLSKLEHWRALAASLPADRLLRQLSGEPFLVDKATSPVYLTLYDRARSYQSSSFCGLYQFMQHLRRILKSKDGLSAAGLQSSDDAVSIMTMHKSKGLQFPIVFVGSCAANFNDDDLRSTVMFDAHLGAAAKIYVPETAELRETVTRRAIARLLDVRHIEEEMRLLYVALTRAQERLYVTASLTGSAATPMARAAAIGSNTRHSILSANCYLSWILAAMEEYKRTGEEPLWELKILNRDLNRHPHPVTTHESESDELDSLPIVSVSPAGERYRAIIERHRTYEDPRALLRTLPTKAAASKLRTAMLDGVWLPEELDGESEGEKDHSDQIVSGDSEEAIRHRIELMRRSKVPFAELLSADNKATAAERGTATHLFLQHCDFRRLQDGGMEEEIARLVEYKFLPRRAADILNRKQLKALCESDLVSLAAHAKSIWREQHFDRFIPYALLTRNVSLAEQLEDYTLYVQGSIDLIIEDAQGELWLFDYKTDRLFSDDTDAIRDQMLSRHADQLRIYVEAVNDLFGRRPDHVCIYSLPLGRSIKLTEQL